LPYLSHLFHSVQVSLNMIMIVLDVQALALTSTVFKV